MSQALALTGDRAEDAHRVMLTVVHREIDAFQAVCAYAGEHGFTDLVYSIPYWLAVAFGEMGEASTGENPVSLGFRDYDSAEFKYKVDDVHPAMVWAGRMAAAWVNGDQDNIRALMQVELTPMTALQYAHSTLLGLALNFTWTSR